ncbi:hypothetical protein DFA_07874 [Cavenderia fasciculata]|uniref:F-box domain-containing protein n=1 Tax=Cavenderia fasciculata TaxID=261658 RepID=F4Q3S7_CACFS|nr:uncharacterized protein DFA_07874 [Cavenderia fasciculata]EGG16893.1 hypothetical protein DFA_07874 [Cavenderia fasciculata]|eukprot:XP_004355367.1 hypothetical protein DFA_07874 [Cavenderia fasciculata]
MHSNNESLELNSLSLSSLPNLPWVVQSEIIYILCNYRKNQDHQVFSIKDVFNIASVSHTWRHATKVSLSLNWRFNISRHSLKEYRQHSETQLCLLSQPNQHTLNLALYHSDDTAESNRIYAKDNLDWFKENVLSKALGMNTDQETKVAGWWDLICPDGGEGGGGNTLPSLKSLTLEIDGQVAVSLDFLHQLEQLEVTLNIDIISCLDLDLKQVFASIPSTITKLTMNDGLVTDQPFPFHLLKATQLSELIVWDTTKSCTRSYYDYVQSKQVRRIVKFGIGSQEELDFLSSSSSPVKDLYLHVSDVPTITLGGKAMVPPMLERLDLGFSLAMSAEVMECIFTHSGPLPKLHTLIIDSKANVLDMLAPFIQKSRSLKTIDFSLCFQRNTSAEGFELLLDAIAASSSIQKVWFRVKSNKAIMGVIKNHIQQIKNNPLVLLENSTIINTINNPIDLSSYSII